MSKNKVIVLDVIRGGIAIPLGNNYYYMKGRKHKNGGIDIGKNPKTGLEVESDEIVHITPKEVKVFSSLPFLNGKSPAQKVLEGYNPNKVFEEQEQFKDTFGIKDNGKLKKDNMNNRNKVNNIYTLVNNGKTTLRMIPSTGKRAERSEAQFGTRFKTFFNDLSDRYNKSKFKKDLNKLGENIKDNFTMSDAIGIGANAIGSIASGIINRKMLDDLEYMPQPVYKQPVKLKTNININPQLDKIRETIGKYERSIDSESSSSRNALARKQYLALDMLNRENELYSNKENIETDLINKNKLNEQTIANANIDTYNQYVANKTDFENNIRDKKSENKIGVTQNIIAGIQDSLNRSEQRRAHNQNVAAIIAAHPNVNPRLLRDYGFDIDDKLIEAYEKRNKK